MWNEAVMAYFVVLPQKDCRKHKKAQDCSTLGQVQNRALFNAMEIANESTVTFRVEC
jgi:hypothetical protein